ncbi:MAG: DinB family protein [Alphaproteobacteria bacterium]|nr:DinB family protein [Alphaproteobacteria bacterium]
MDSAYFQTLSRYNRWANQRLYAACLDLPADDYHADRSAYFKSIGNTLNHILVADRLWMARFHAVDPHITDLAAIPHPDRADLWAARQKMDEDIITFFEGCDNALLATDLTYLDTRGMMKTVPRRLTCGHFFNHQTHHRGQVHGMLSQAGLAEPPPLDLIYYFHEYGVAA